MKSVDSGYFGWCAAIVACSLAFVVPAFTGVPVLWYYPLRHEWALEIRPNGLALDWLGRTLWALTAAVLAGALVRAAARRLPAPRPRAYLVWTVWAAMTSLLAIAVYVYQLAHRHPVPEPLPGDRTGLTTIGGDPPV